MKKKCNVKKLFTVMLVVCMLISAYTIPASAAAKPKLSASKKTLTVGNSYTLTLKNNKKVVKWSISKASVVQMKKLSNNSVKLTAKKAGSARVTAKVGKKSYVCKVTVKAAPKLNVTSKQLAIGESFKLKLTGGTGTVKWKNYNKSVVSMKKISKNVYQIKAKKTGQAKITVKVGKKTLTCYVYGAKRDYGGKGKRGTYAFYQSVYRKGALLAEKGSKTMRKSGSVVTVTPTLDRPGDIIRGYCNRDKAQWRIISGKSVVIVQDFQKGGSDVIPTGYKDALVYGLKKGSSVLGLYENGKLLIKVTVNVTKNWPGYDHYKKWKTETTKKIWNAAYPGEAINSLTDREKIEALVEADFTKYVRNGEKTFFWLARYGVSINKEDAEYNRVLFIGDVAKDLGCTVEYYDWDDKKIGKVPEAGNGNTVEYVSIQFDDGSVEEYYE